MDNNKNYNDAKNQDSNSSNNLENNDKVEIWNDIVSIIDLSKTICISLCSTLGLFYLAPKNNTTMQLFFGLIGAVIAVIINSIIVKPKRKVEEE